jgi:hypothetical protein
MLDHVSCSFSVDECIDFWQGAHDSTIQYSLIAWPLHKSTHQYTLDDPNIGHARAMMIGEEQTGLTTGNISVLHNIIANAWERFPEAKPVTDRPVDVVGNVMYNWGAGSGTQENKSYVFLFNDANGSPTFNIIANYFKKGPSSTGTERDRIRFNDNPQGDTSTAYVYLQNNVDAQQGPIAEVAKSVSTLMIYYGAAAYGSADYFTPNTAQDGLFSLTAEGGAGASMYRGCAGGWYARRDSLDQAAMADVLNGTARLSMIPAR